MITINDRFQFERADQCWELHEWKDGINPKNKQPTRSKHTTYHASVMQICTVVLDRASGGAESLVGLMATIKNTAQELQSAVNNQ